MIIHTIGFSAMPPMAEWFIPSELGGPDGDCYRRVLQTTDPAKRSCVASGCRSRRYLKQITRSKEYLTTAISAQMASLLSRAALGDQAKNPLELT